VSARHLDGATNKNPAVECFPQSSASRPSDGENFQLIVAEHWFPPSGHHGAPRSLGDPNEGTAVVASRGFSLMTLAGSGAAA
jgi:hypothetical protein